MLLALAVGVLLLEKPTTFTVLFRFPIAESENAEEAGGALSSGDVRFKGKRILVVEDNPINAEIAGEILRQEGFEPDFAGNGGEAVEILLSKEPHYYSVVLMDLQMPVMDGITATCRIRAFEDERAQVPIIALTANSFDDDRKKALEAGMDDFVSKPFDPVALVATIAKYIR